jgi:hypothetical protein
VKEVADWSASESDNALSGWLAQSRQPELLTLVLALTLAWMRKAPLGLRAREGAKALIIAALWAVVDTLDEAARLN